MNGRVFCTDCLEHSFVFLAVKAAEWICAQDIYIVCFDQIVPKLFDPNCRVPFTFRTQESDTFTENSNARMFCHRGFRC
jgi:hypothetical protein